MLVICVVKSAAVQASRGVWGHALPEIFENKGLLKWPFRAICVVFKHVLRAIYLLFVGITACKLRLF